MAMIGNNYAKAMADSAKKRIAIPSTKAPTPGPISGMQPIQKQLAPDYSKLLPEFSQPPRPAAASREREMEAARYGGAMGPNILKGSMPGSDLERRLADMKASYNQQRGGTLNGNPFATAISQANPQQKMEQQQREMEMRKQQDERRKLQAMDATAGALVPAAAKNPDILRMLMQTNFNSF